MIAHDLINQLQTVYNGSPWYGESIIEKMNQVSDDSFARVVNEKSVVRVLDHMIVWRDYVIEKLKGNETYEIELSSSQDWILLDGIIADKSTYMKRLEKSQRTLVDLLQSKDDDWFQEITLGKNYSNLSLVQRVIEHDLYHLGQIGLLNSWITNQKISN